MRHVETAELLRGITRLASPLLHLMSTPERVIGLLIGSLHEGAPEPDAITPRLFSLVVVDATHMLKILLLNRQIHQHNASLEQAALTGNEPAIADIMHRLRCDIGRIADER